MPNKWKKKAARALRRRRRVRGQVNGTAEIPRLTVAKSLNNIYVQVIDDLKKTTLVGLGTDSKEMAARFKDKDTKTDKAKKIGQAIGEKAVALGLKQVVFDRNRFRYHGRIKAVAEGAREKGLEF